MIEEEESANPYLLQADEEEEIKKLLGQTFTNNDYQDEETKLLINKPSHQEPTQKTDENSSNLSSVLQPSELSEIQPYEQDHSMYKSQPSDEVHQDLQSQNIIQKPATQLQLIEKQQLEAYLPLSSEDISKQYKMHLVNEEQKVKLTQNFDKGVPYYVNNHLKNHKKQVAGVQVFYESNARTFLIWTLQGQIIIFLPNSDKRIQFKPFETEITALTISSNMEMIAIASNNMQFAVYRLREPIRIEDSLTYRLLAKPILFQKIDHKNLECNITQVQFIQIDGDLQFLVLNQYDQVSTIKIQKRLLKYKVVVQPLPLTFNTVFMFKSFRIPFAEMNYLGIVISSADAVTFAILKPKFQLIFIKQQTSRANIVKQGRTPFIDFCNDMLMIVWDKFVDIIKIQIANVFGQPEYKVNTQCHYFFAENSLAVGFLSDTLIYQFSRTGLRAYSLKRFTEGPYVQNKIYSVQTAEIYHQQLVLQKIPQVGLLVGQILRNSQPPLTQLKYLNQKIGCTLAYNKNNQNNSLVYAYEAHSIQSLEFLSYKSYVSRLIDSEGNWRFGLNVLKRVYEGNVFELDCIRFDHQTQKDNRYLRQFKNICQDYVIRFVQKTKNIIKVDRGQNHWNKEDIQSQQSLFICDFLIRTDNSQFLMDEVVLKMEPQIDCLKSLKAFILLKKLKTFGHQNISYFFSNLEQTFLSKLIYSLDIQKNQVHQIKSNAIKKNLYLQFVYLCTQQRDFYTPFVILMAMYKEDKNKNLILLLLYFLKKSISGQKMPIGTYPTQIHRQILKQVILKILTPQVYQQIFKIAPLILFEEVLPCFFLSQTLPPLNSLESDKEIRDQFAKLRLQNDIIKSLIIGNIPKNAAEVHCKGAYWLFILKIFSRSLIVRTNIVEGLYYLTIHELIDKSLVKEVLSKKEAVRQLQEYKNLQDFSERLSSLQYTELQVLLLKIARRYIEGIKLLLSDSQTKGSIFELLDQVVHKLNAEELEQLSLVIRNNIKYLAQKDITRLQWLLTTFYSNQQQLFLGGMVSYPQLQLSLMSQFLKRKDSENHELRVAYLELLAKLGYTTKVERQIFTNLYPLDESLEICKKYGILKGEAYIYERTGDVTKALNTHFEIINRQIQFIDLKDWSNEVMVKTLYETLRQSMRSCSTICKSISERGDYQSEIFWMRIVQGFQGLKLKSTYHHFLICKVINQMLFPQLFQQIISQVQLSSILLYIEQNVKKLQFGTVRLLFILLMKAYAYESQMLLRCKTMMEENVDDIRDVIIKHYRQGFVSSGQCNMCSGRDDLVIRYPCGHQIHPYCGTNIRICEVCSLQDKTYIIRQIINKQELKFDVLQLLKEPENQNFQKKTRREKLLQYEYKNNIIDQYTKSKITNKK